MPVGTQSTPHPSPQPVRAPMSLLSDPAKLNLINVTQGWAHAESTSLQGELQRMVDLLGCGDLHEQHGCVGPTVDGASARPARTKVTERLVLAVLSCAGPADVNQDINGISAKGHVKIGTAWICLQKPDGET
jgi:hypothetical protein